MTSTRPADGHPFRMLVLCKPWVAQSRVYQFRTVPCQRRTAMQKPVPTKKTRAIPLEFKISRTPPKISSTLLMRVGTRRESWEAVSVLFMGRDQLTPSVTSTGTVELRSTAAC